MPSPDSHPVSLPTEYCESCGTVSLTHHECFECPLCALRAEMIATTKLTGLTLLGIAAELDTLSNRLDDLEAK